MLASTSTLPPQLQSLHPRSNSQSHSTPCLHTYPPSHRHYHSAPSSSSSTTATTATSDQLTTADLSSSSYPLIPDHLQLPLDLENYQPILQQLHSDSNSSFFSSNQFGAPPLTPTHSQSHSQSLSLPISYTSPLSSSSPSFSSPAFSAQNSPTTDFLPFYQGPAAGAVPSSSSSMTESTFSPTADLSHTPPIRLHQSSPPFGDRNLDHDISSMLLQSELPYDSQQADPSKFDQSKFNPLARSHHPHGAAAAASCFRHRKALSGSSGASASSSGGAVSPPNRPLSSFSPSTLSSNKSFDDSNQSSTTSAAPPLPTPEQTPVQNSFLAPAFQSYDPSSRNGEAAVEMAMRRALEQPRQQQQQRQKSQQSQQSHQQQSQQHYQQQQQPHQLHHHHHQTQGEDDRAFSYPLAAPSMSSMSHNSPVTPQTNFADLSNEASKGISHGEDRFVNIDQWMDDYLRFDDQVDFSGQQMGIPKLGRTISDSYQDELYNPSMQQSVPAGKAGNKNMSSYQNVFADRLQAAQQGHISAQSHSPATNRQRSPFRQGSPYARSGSSYNASHLQQPLRLNQALPMTGHQQPSGMEGMGLMQEDQGEPKTISPKDALLEYSEHPDDAANMPLFTSQPDSTPYSIPTTMGTSGFQVGTNFPTLDHFPTQFDTSKSQIPQQYSMAKRPSQQLTQLPYQQQQHTSHGQSSHGRSTGDLMQHTPDFSTNVSSLASTNNDTNTPGLTSPTAQRQRPQMSQHTGVSRPSDTGSDAGTYSCTYHGCLQRFETPAKLQKHKREAHRQPAPGSNPMGQTLSSNTLSMRNSQAGPHRCERINPATGKKCNSVFSRPYDLTRHEDTIHNARKQKVRCHLCTEEKTFSRNDALTRHMRVVHPDVDWPGKQKRRGT